MPPRSAQTTENSTADQALGYLEAVSDKAAGRGLVTLLITTGTRPLLQVSHPADPNLTGQVIAEPVGTPPPGGGEWWLWWTWGERIGPITGHGGDIAGALTRAADIIVADLGLTPAIGRS
jgi:hypothetical protein